jgi:hypothetical protein
MASATFMFGGRALRVEGRSDAVGLARAVLRHHEHPAASEAEAGAVLRLIRCDAGAGAAANTARGRAPAWTWAVPEHVVRDGPDWFFYYGFAQVLHQVWDGLGFVRLHGALLCGEESGGILVTGERHDGKSSVAAGWLEQGGALATDDTVLLDAYGCPPRGVGVLRELHLDRSLAPVLTRLDGLAEAEPYLPGRPRIRYDWVTRFPAQVVRVPVAIGAVIRTRVAVGRPTSARRIGQPAAAEVIRAAVEGDTGRLGPARQWLDSVPVWEVTWGPDLWSMPGMHRGYLGELCSAVPR